MRSLRPCRVARRSNSGVRPRPPRSVWVRAPLRSIDGAKLARELAGIFRRRAVVGCRPSITACGLACGFVALDDPSRPFCGNADRGPGFTSHGRGRGFESPIAHPEKPLFSRVFSRLGQSSGRARASDSAGAPWVHRRRCGARSHRRSCLDPEGGVRGVETSGSVAAVMLSTFIAGGGTCNGARSGGRGRWLSDRVPGRWSRGMSLARLGPLGGQHRRRQRRWYVTRRFDRAPCRRSARSRDVVRGRFAVVSGVGLTGAGEALRSVAAHGGGRWRSPSRW